MNSCGDVCVSSQIFNQVVIDDVDRRVFRDALYKLDAIIDNTVCNGGLIGSLEKNGKLFVIDEDELYSVRRVLETLMCAEHFTAYND